MDAATNLTDLNVLRALRVAKELHFGEVSRAAPSRSTPRSSTSWPT
jgi:hypothetical protein